MSQITFSYLDNSGLFLQNNFNKKVEENLSFLSRIINGEERYSSSLGWHSVSKWAGEEKIREYEEIGKRVREKADALVVIGVGGSNQAARAVYEALGKKSETELFWLGNTISGDTYQKTIEKLDEKKSIYINCIAKNFETLEPGLGFRIMREYLKKRYGSSYSSRIIVTFTENTPSWKMAEGEGYTLLPFPLDIGGRYSSLSPVSLFPLSVAGIDISSLAKGAKEMEKELKENISKTNSALLYATSRTLLYNLGYKVELLSFFEPRFYRFSKWWKQLFAESEGKENKGLLTQEASYSEDLHSLGQFVQEGSPILFETFLNLKQKDYLVTVSPSSINDGFSYLDNKELWDINKNAYLATLTSHSNRFPALIIDVDALNEYSLGALFYFFQFSCYLSASILSLNPFDQNGVEQYKKDMFKRLGK